MKEKILKFLPWLLIITGALLVTAALYLNYSTLYHQRRLVDEYNAYISQLEAQGENKAGKLPAVLRSGEEEEAHDVPAEGGLISSESPVAKYLEGKELSGIILIPKLNVKAAILEGTGDGALKYTVGHFPGTPHPGETGNSVLLGHRNYIYGHYFRHIDRLKPGDEVVIKRGRAMYTYTVTESFVVSPQELWVLDDTEEAIITMITCTPVPAYTHRLIVRAELDLLKSSAVSGS